MILENLISASKYANEYPLLYQTILCIEEIFLLTALPSMFIFAFLLYKTKYYSKNYIFLTMHICFLFPFYGISEIYCIVLQIIYRFSLEELDNQIWFKIATASRTFYIMLGCITVPTFAIERFFATAFVNNYEKKPRIYISIILIIITDICSICLTLGRILNLATYLPYLLIVGISNIFAVIMFFICHRKNLQFYQAKFPSSTSTSSYSLSLRYQIIENIRCGMIQKRLFNVAFIFTLTLAILFATAYIHKDFVITNICYQTFELIIAVYVTVIPIIGILDAKILNQIRSWKVWQRNVHPVNLYPTIAITPTTTVTSTTSATTEIRTVFGVETVKSNEDATQMYFSQLAQSWN